MKEHLYHYYKIYNEEDRLKWETDNLVWRYFDKINLYVEKLNFLAFCFSKHIIKFKI